MTSSELVELVKREFPGWSAEEYDGGVRLWPSSEPWQYAPKLAFIDFQALVAFGLDGPSKDLDLADPLSALEYATGETALSRRKPDIITRAVEELRAAFPEYTWTVATEATPETSCIYADNLTNRALFVQYKSQFVWLAGVTGEALHNWTGSKPCTAFDALIHSNGYRELVAGQTELPRKNFTTLIPPDPAEVRMHMLKLAACSATHGTDAQAQLDAARAEVARLTKALDVCNDAHGHNVKLKAANDRLTAELDAARADVARLEMERTALRGALIVREGLHRSAEMGERLCRSDRDKVLAKSTCLTAEVDRLTAEVERLKADVSSLDVLARGERAMVDTANDVIADLRAKISECAALGLELGRRLTERDAEVGRLTAREREAASLLRLDGGIRADWKRRRDAWLAGCAP